MEYFIEKTEKVISTAHYIANNCKYGHMFVCSNSFLLLHLLCLFHPIAQFNPQFVCLFSL